MRAAITGIIFVLIMLAMVTAGHAQVVPDTTSAKVDSLKQRFPSGNKAPISYLLRDIVPVKRGPFQPNPKKAGLYSSLVPGLGQLYNRQYWKIPVIYAGVAVAGYYIGRNLNLYQSYRKAYINRINNPNYKDEYTDIYSSDQLQQLQNDYNKYLDLSVLFTALGYGLQIVDAITSAHLKNFDVSRDISMRMFPVVVPKGAGMALVMSFR